jgi:hypothetical protein
MNKFYPLLLASCLSIGCLPSSNEVIPLNKDKLVHAEGHASDSSECYFSNDLKGNLGSSLDHVLDNAFLSFDDGYEIDDVSNLPVVHFYSTEKECLDVLSKLSQDYIFVELEGYMEDRTIVDARLRYPQ